MDTKYPHGYKQGKVIYTIIDDATRWVYAWSYSTANAENTLNFIKKVRDKAPFPIQKIRRLEQIKVKNSLLTRSEII